MQNPDWGFECSIWYVFWFSLNRKLSVPILPVNGLLTDTGTSLGKKKTHALRYKQDISFWDTHLCKQVREHFKFTSWQVNGAFIGSAPWHTESAVTFYATHIFLRPTFQLCSLPGVFIYLFIRDIFDRWQGWFDKLSVTPRPKVGARTWKMYNRIFVCFYQS